MERLIRRDVLIVVNLVIKSAMYFHIPYFHRLNIFIQGKNSINALFYNLALFKLKYVINSLQINDIK